MKDVSPYSYIDSLVQSYIDPTFLFCIAFNKTFAAEVSKLRQRHKIDIQALQKQVSSLTANERVLSFVLRYCRNYSAGLKFHRIKLDGLVVEIHERFSVEEQSDFVRELEKVTNYENQHQELLDNVETELLQKFKLSQRYKRRLVSLVLYGDLPAVEECFTFDSSILHEILYEKEICA